MNKEFIFFGCWNNGFCNPNDNKNGMSQVINSILFNEVPNFYLIAGDNYYPEKTKDKSKDKSKKKSIKYFNETNFNSGFNCLDMLTYKDPDPGVFFLMGNHDVDPIRISEQDNTIDCIVTKKQIELINKNPRFNYTNQVIIVDNTIIIMLNTTLFTDKKLAYFECCKLLSYYTGNNLNEYLIYYKKQLINEINNTLKIYNKHHKDFLNVIITGHDPIIGPKNKNGIDKYTPIDLFGIELVYELYEMFYYAKKYYLCADVHLYLEGTINLRLKNKKKTRKHEYMKRSKKSKMSKSRTSKSRTSKSQNKFNLKKYIMIQQYVIGTGGAKLDECSINPNILHLIDNYKTNKKFEIDYHQEYCEKNFGYLRVSIGPQIKFIWNSI